MEAHAEGYRYVVAIGHGRRDRQTESSQVIGHVDLAEEGILGRRVQEQRQGTAILVDRVDPKRPPAHESVNRRCVRDVIDRGTGGSIGERPLPVAHTVRPREEHLSPRPRGHLFAGEALDNAESALHEGPQRRSDLGDHGPFLAVGNGNLFTGWKHQWLFPLITGV